MKYNSTPNVFVSANHSSSSGNQNPLHNGITAWVEVGEIFFTKNLNNWILQFETFHWLGHYGVMRDYTTCMLYKSGKLAFDFYGVVDFILI